METEAPRFNLTDNSLLRALRMYHGSFSGPFESE